MGDLMEEKIINGRPLSERIETELKQSIKGCIIRPSVAVISVGSDPINDIHIKLKEEACNRVGIYFRFYNFEEDTTELTIINKIKELNNDDYVNGISIQLPLPPKYNEKRLINSILNSKDVDGLTDINTGRFMNDRKSIVPAAADAVIELLKEYNVELEGKSVTIIGRGNLVGKPLIKSFLNEGATVTICHSKTKDLKKYTIDSDIVVSATGIKDLIKDDMVNEKSVVIDVGSHLENKKIYGDVDFDKVKDKVTLITPIIGGVGPVTVSIFLKNVVFCYNNSKKNKPI